MGYFNFYFLKKLLQNKKIKKFFIFIIVFIILLILKNNVFAVIDVEYNNTHYSLPDFPSGHEYNYQLIQYVSNPAGKFRYLGWDNPYEFNINGSGILSPISYNHSTNPVHYTSNYPDTNTSNWSWSTYSSSPSISSNKIVWANFTVSYKDSNGNDVVVYEPPESYDNFPHFLNDSDSIAEGGQSLVIMPGDFSNTKEIRFCIQSVTEDNNIISYNNLFAPQSLTKDSQFYVSAGSDEGFYYSIPWNFINSYISLSNKYNYVLAYDIRDETYKEEVEVIYGGITPDDAIYNGQINNNQAIEDQTNAINNQTQIIEQQTQAIEGQTQAIEGQTQAIEGLNDTMTDSTIESGASDLPTTNVQDPTQNGIDNIFQSIYNAFCTGQAQDIIFPIPFTNKNIVLSPYYVRDMLNNNGSSWIYTLIQAFWGYIIGRFIVKDISKKITKIKSGNIENIENQNIKEEML